MAEPALKVVGDETPPLDARKTVRAGLVIIAIAFLGFGGWAALVPLSAAVIAAGEVKVESNRKTVQHLEGGIVAAIHVRDGDMVQAGQTLIELQSEQVAASLDIVTGQLDAELAKNARLRSERDRKDTIDFPPELTSRRDQPGIVALMESEQRFFNSKLAALNAQLKLMSQQVDESRREIEALKDQVAAEERAIALFEEEVAANRTLEAKQYVQKTQILALRRGMEDFTSRRGAHRADIARAEQRITDLELRRVGLVDRYVQEAASELTDSQAKVFDLQDRMRPSRDALRRQRITAPIGGTVVGLKVFTVGGVVRAGEPLMDIVPVQRKLIFDVKLDVKDIDEVKIGAEAEVRLSALDQRTTPLITGTVEYVSPDRLIDEASRLPYYAVRVVADEESLQKAVGLRIQPGMAAEVFVKTTERTLLEYWLEPVTTVLRRTMRET